MKGRIDTALLVEILVGTRGVKPRESWVPCADRHPEEEDAVADKRRKPAPKRNVRWWKRVLAQTAEARCARTAIVRLFHVGGAANAADKSSNMSDGDPV